MNVYECVEDSFPYIFHVPSPFGPSEKRACVNSKHALEVREHVLLRERPQKYTKANKDKAFSILSWGQLLTFQGNE